MIAAFRQLHPSVRIRLLTTFLSKVFGTTVVPFMGLMFAREAGALTAGALLAAQFGLQFVVGLYGGAASDTYGRRRMMVWGEAVKLLAFGLMLLAALGGALLWPMFAALLVLSVGNGLTNPAGEALLIDASTPADRAFMYSVNYWGNNLGYLVGAPLGALLFTDHLGVLMGLLTGMAAVILWVTARFIRNVQTADDQMAGPPAAPRPAGFRALLASYRQVATHRTFLWFTAGGTLILSIEYSRTTFLAVRLDRDLSGQTLTLPLSGLPLTFDGARALALLSAENTLLIVLSTAAVARFLTGRDPRRWMLVGFALFGAGYLAAMGLDTPLALLGAGLVLTLGELLYVPTRQAVQADMIDPARRGAYMAVGSLVFQFGKLLAAGGLMLWPLLGQGGLMAAMALFTVAGSLISWGASALGTRAAQPAAAD
ncbi:MFS transporter [Deinococcus koreensis]|uniref:MFS transporter n=1 Tax=Deinococcus koreensis TaxID=2054903 RepID=A0A2K3UYD6_9DEIO|nr:MFS transporter [Deinococcus koreensis]PNY81553.1 MFS transporter [Deinococcus koreensis]